MLGRKDLTATILPEAPPLPELLDYLWTWFCELTLGLPSSGMGPIVVTWESLQAWSSHMQVDLDPWEARALVKLGMTRANVANEKIAAASKIPE